MTHWSTLLDPEGETGAYLPWKKVEARVGISRTTAWRMQKAGDFPKPYVVSPGRVAYRESEVEAWKASREYRGTKRIAAKPRAPKAPSPAADSPPTRAAEPPAPPTRIASQPSPKSKSRRPVDSRQISFNF